MAKTVLPPISGDGMFKHRVRNPIGCHAIFELNSRQDSDLSSFNFELDFNNPKGDHETIFMDGNVTYSLQPVILPKVANMNSLTMSQEAQAALEELRNERKSGARNLRNSNYQLLSREQTKLSTHFLPRLSQTDNTMLKTFKKKRKRQKWTVSGRFNHLQNKDRFTRCKAPYSYTAERIATRNRLKESNDCSSSSVTSISSTLDDADRTAEKHRNKLFEITPIGYDSRYQCIQPPDGYCQSEDDEEIVKYITDKATAKCQDWLNNQVFDA